MAIENRSKIVNKLKPDSSSGVEYIIAPTIMVDTTTNYTASCPTLEKDEIFAFQSNLEDYLRKDLNFTAKGDIIYAADISTPATLGIGTNGQFMTVSSEGLPEWKSYPTSSQSGVKGSSTITYTTRGLIYDNEHMSAIVKNWTTTGNLDTATAKVKEEALAGNFHTSLITQGTFPKARIDQEAVAYWDNKGEKIGIEDLR